MSKFAILKGARFRVLHLIGSWLTACGVASFVVILGFVVIGLFPSEGMSLNLDAAMTLYLVAWGVALIVSGQLLHWLVAMKNSQDQVIQLLKEIRDQQLR